MTITEKIKKLSFFDFLKNLKIILADLLTLINTPATDTRVYKVYSVLLTQESTDAPVPVILESTLDELPTWSYESQGYYILTFPFPIDQQKVFFTISPNVSTAKSAQVFIVDGNSLGVYTYTDNGTTTPTLDDYLDNTPFEVKIYE
jgi:hypothetical protein